MNSNTLRIVTLAVLTISLIANAFFVVELGGTDERVQELKDKEAMLMEQYKVLQRNYEVTKENFEVLRQKDFSPITLESSDIENTARATIYWNSEDYTVYLDGGELPRPPANKQYQVWMIKGDAYTDLGVFNYQTDVANFFRMKNAVKANGFAVSLEKIRGDKQPTNIVVYRIFDEKIHSRYRVKNLD